MIDFDKPVCTKNGKSPAELLYMKQGNSYKYKPVGYQIIGSEQMIAGAWWHLDLENVPQKRSGWVNVYRMADGLTRVGEYVHSDKKKAVTVGATVSRITSDEHIATAHIEWTE